MKKVAVVGQYGEGPEYVTGQAVKTYFIAQWLMRRFGPENVEIVNTYGWKKRPARLLCSLLAAMKGCGSVVMLPAQHGVKVFAPLVAGLNRLFRRRIFYIVIGGWLADTLRENPRLLRAVAAFDGVCAETESLAARLREAGVKNAWCLPNCRDYTGAEQKELPEAPPLPVCTYSRVTRSKGIEDAARICRRANGLLGFHAFTLEVYGMIDPEYREAFDLAVARSVAPMNVLCELMLPLVKVGGVMVAMKSVGSDQEIAAARGAVGQLGGKVRACVDYTIPGTDVTHRLVVIDKVRPTPPQFPRAFAKIKKQPLK